MSTTSTTIAPAGTSTTTTSPTTPGPAGASGGSEALTAAAVPGLGVLGVSGDYFAQEKANGIKYVTVGVGWANAEPANGSFDVSYASSISQEIVAARAAGLGVILDPGLQYAPAWALTLSGGTQFVDQYGDIFTGSPTSGNDVVNAVTDMAVRSAEGSYLQWLGAQLSGAGLVAIRVGGGPFGELRYPDGSYNGHTDCFWAYDSSTQASSPVPGWVPATGTVAEATAFLNSYNANLNGYGDWLSEQVGVDFATDQLIMLPGWGERPGVSAEETASLLTLGYEEFSEGLDWADLLPSLPDRNSSIAYTTYLDAAAVEQTPQLTDPADFIASLVAPLGMREGGENTGDGTVADLQLVVERAQNLQLAIVNWMSEAQVIATDEGSDPEGPSLAELDSASLILSGGT